MSPPHPLEILVGEAVSRHELISARDHVLAAVSGGPDSTAMLHVLASIRGELGNPRLTVLHFNHQIRGNASIEEQERVRSAAGELGLPFRAGTRDVPQYAREHRMSLEMAARVCRHRFFEESRKDLGGTKIALGHNADDQAEEILLRLIRGSGPSGLGGMPPKDAHGIIRPLLDAPRGQVLDYLHHRQISYIEDPSNLQPFCQRNVLRLEVFPVLHRSFHSRVVETLCRHAELVRREEAYWKERVLECRPTVFGEETPSRVHLNVEALRGLHPVLRTRVLRWAVEKLRGNTLGLYSRHWDAMSRWVDESSEGKSMHLPGKLRLTRSREFLVLGTREAPIAPENEDARITLSGPGTYPFSGFEISLSRHGPEEARQGEKSSHRACLDASAVCGSLSVRFRRKGDRFRPVGLGGSRKLQDFFTDRKIPRAERDRIPLLCDEEKICWVMGYRLDDRVKVTASTREVFVVEFRSAEVPTREGTAGRPGKAEGPGSPDGGSPRDPSGHRGRLRPSCGP